MTVAVVSFGTSNVGSVANMLRKLDVEAVVTDDPAAIAAAERIVLPGVGSFDVAMRNLETRGLLPVLNEQRDAGVPILGVCLGMQLFADGSEEGVLPGLGWVPGQVRRLPSVGAEGPLRVPHMGWNRVYAARPSPLLDALPEEARFYFVHSYAYHPADDADALGTTPYGAAFVSIVARDNVVGTQFHPEKSHRYGKALLDAWVRS